MQRVELSCRNDRLTNLATTVSESTTHALDELKKRMDAFGDNLPLLKLMAGCELSERHWSQINDAINAEEKLDSENT